MTLVPFDSLFPGFRPVPPFISTSRTLAHLTRARYGLPCLNDTHVEWEHEAIAALAAEGYVASVPVWQDVEHFEHGVTRSLHVHHAEAGDFYVTYWLPKEPPPLVPERLIRSFIRR